ncbi:transcriptional regulator, AbrB family [Priestia aryabhattai B8W22]|uniref:AbrB/MazE/SpoVT family DNA-binding domain-containing protein n=1 Tax=Priestia aryabhattai TaxID=412384 RepID=UPI000887F5F1|nr:transcriptional regulator, AbrB family [Priestia aryabhattai B8W22]
MKSTGMVRKLDQLGRVVLPVELRRALDVKTQDSLEIYVDGDRVIFKKYVPSMTCHVTGENSENNVKLLGGKLVLSPDVLQDIMVELGNKPLKNLRRR